MGSSIETSRGNLKLLLPAALSAVPAIAGADETSEGAGEIDSLGSFSKFEIAGGASALLLTLMLAGLGLTSMRAKRNALKFLDMRLARSNATIGARVDEGLASYRVHRSWGYVGDGSRQMENLGGLSPEAGRLAADMADILDARAGDDISNIDIILREVGMTSRFADYWRDADHEKNAWKMNLIGIMLYGSSHGFDAKLREAIGRVLMRGSTRKRDFDPVKIFKIAAEAHQRIGRARKIDSNVFTQEIELVKALHMVAATAMWLERADYASDTMDKRWSLYWARGALDEAHFKLTSVMAKKTEWFDQKGSPLTRVLANSIELDDEIDLRREVVEGPPEDGGFGGAISGGDASGAKAADGTPGAAVAQFSAFLYSSLITPTPAIQMAFGSPLLSMI